MASRPSCSSVYHGRKGRSSSVDCQASGCLCVTAEPAFMCEVQLQSIVWQRRDCWSKRLSDEPRRTAIRPLVCLPWPHGIVHERPVEQLLVLLRCLLPAQVLQKVSRDIDCLADVTFVVVACTSSVGRSLLFGKRSQRNALRTGCNMLRAAQHADVEASVETRTMRSDLLHAVALDDLPGCAVAAVHVHRVVHRLKHRVRLWRPEHEAAAALPRLCAWAPAWSKFVQLQTSAELFTTEAAGAEATNENGSTVTLALMIASCRSKTR